MFIVRSGIDYSGQNADDNYVTESRKHSQHATTRYVTTRGVTAQKKQEVNRRFRRTRSMRTKPCNMFPNAGVTWCVNCF